MKTLSDNDEGATAVLEYVITFTCAFVLFTYLLAMFSSMFIDGPQRTVSQVQFTDVGNDITAKILDTYLVAPATGNISTVFSMPAAAAGKDYQLDIRKSANGWDKEIVVYSPYMDIDTMVTLNGVNATIPIIGNTSSMSPVHRVRYDS